MVNSPAPLQAQDGGLVSSGECADSTRRNAEIQGRETTRKGRRNGMPTPAKPTTHSSVQLNARLRLRKEYEACAAQICFYGINAMSRRPNPILLFDSVSSSTWCELPSNP